MVLKKLKRTSIAGNILLLMIALVSVAATSQTFYAGQQSGSDSTTQRLSFDTTLLLLSGTVDTTSFEAPGIAMNKKAVTFVNDYLEKNSELLGKIRERSAQPFRTMDAIFTKYGLPVQLKYAAVVESQLKTTAISRVGAVGTWQFMAVTAKYFSLKITPRYDERKNLTKSTVAAARYFKDLHKLFGDWLLVIAAYNAGPGRVYEAIKKSGSRNFWKLQHFLPAETRGHVKKFISTHYYFEGGGSIATLTREEANGYRKKMLSFVEQHNLSLQEKEMSIAVNKFRENEIPVKEIAKGETQPVFTNVTVE